jgi:hypothetical protein
MTKHMTSTDEQWSIDKLNEKLNSKSRYHEPDDVRSPVEASETGAVDGTWDSPDLDEMLHHERRQPETNNYLMKRVFVGAVIFFLGGLGLASWAYFGGASFISSKNVEIRVIAPTSISAGEVVEMEIVISNKNNADLTVTNLAVQYPQGTRNPDDPTQSYTYAREELGSIRAGREATYTGRAVLFGERGETKEIRVSVEYRVQGSNATFYKEKIYELVIGDSPITMNVSQPSSVTSGDIFTTTLTLSLNSDEPMKNVVIKAEYPYGFTLVDSTPAVSGDGNTWLLGDFDSGTKKTLTIQGRLLGENGDERSFRYYLGVADTADRANFGITVASTLETTTIARPSVALSIDFNNSQGSTQVIPAGQTVNAFIRFQNNLPDKIISPRLEARFSGTALDRTSVRVQGGGFYDSQSNRIVWDLEDSLGKPDLQPGARGGVSFSFNSIPNVGANQEIGVELVLAGVSIGDVNRQISVSEKRNVKVASQISLSAKTLYSIGAFTNRGPVPPIAEEETSYTLVFTLGNTRNEIENAQMTAILGPNVSWLGTNSDEVSFNPNNKTITWNVGTLGSGAGFSLPTREVAVQVLISPSLSQVGLSASLASSISFTGTDSFTGNRVTATTPAINTNMPEDPKFVQGDGTVKR